MVRFFSTLLVEMDKRIALILDESYAKIVKELLDCDRKDGDVLLKYLENVDKALQHFSLNTRDLLSTLNMHTHSSIRLNTFKRW